VSAGALLVAERLHRSRPDESPRRSVAVLTAFALVTAIGSSWFAAVGLNAIPATGALLIHAASVFAALLYSRRYGSPMLGLAVMGALIMPAAVGGGVESAPLLAALLVIAFGSLIWIARSRGWLVWSWISATGAAVWGLAAAFIGGDATQVGSASAYLAAIAAIGVVYASSAMREPPPLLRPWTMRVQFSEPLLTGGALALCATFASLFLFATAGEVAFWAALGVVSIAAVAAIAAALAEGWSLFALAMALTGSALAFGPWPPQQAPLIAASAALLSVSLAVGGWLGVARAHDPTPGALLAAFGPVTAMSAAYIRVGPIGGAEEWAAAAGILAGLNLLCFIRIRSLGRAAAAATIFLVGTVSAAAVAIVFIAPVWTRLAALGLLCLALATIDRRLDRRELRLSAAVVAAAGLAMAIADLQTSGAPPWTAGWLEPKAVASLLAAGLLYASSILLSRGEERLYSRPTQILSICAAAAVVVAAIAQMRGDASQAGLFTLDEVGVYALIALGVAAGFSVRFGPKPRAHMFTVELFSLACALLLTLGVNGVILNPWWGLQPAAVRGPPFLNELMVAYAAPALALILYGWLRAQHGLLLRANAVAAVGLALTPFWLSMELRRFFHPDSMAVGPVMPSEGFAMTLVWLMFAAGLVWFGRLRDLRILRTTGYGIALAALAKSAVLDVAALDNSVLRIVAFVGVAAVAVGLIVLYNRRRLFNAAASMRLDPNLLPPQ
jgi:hypothetical protein